MKVTLDLGKLLADGKITQGEHDRLLQFAAHGTGSLAFNLLIGFGVIAVAAGAVALVPDALTGIVLGLVVLAGGLALNFVATQSWGLLANICILVGALGLAGGIVVLDQGSLRGFVLVTAGFAIIGVAARSSLLIAGAVLALSTCVGAWSGYMEATYFVAISEPTADILLFSLLAPGTYLVSKQLPHDYERLALTAARTSLFMVNLGFWIGSLWGDTIEEANLVIPDLVYVVGWAVALIAVGVWAAWANRRWVVNLVAVFGAIHFYTQWFERLGAMPASILIAGLIALALAVAFWRFNQTIWQQGTPPAGEAATPP